MGSEHSSIVLEIQQLMDEYAHRFVDEDGLGATGSLIGDIRRHLNVRLPSTG